MNNVKIDMHRHQQRLWAEKRFHFYGKAAATISALILVLLVGSLIIHGYHGFMQTQLKLNIHFDPALMEAESTKIAPKNASKNPQTISPSRYMRLVKVALRSQFPDVTDPQELKSLYDLISLGSGNTLKSIVIANTQIWGKNMEIWLPASSNADLYFKGVISAQSQEWERPLNNAQLGWLKRFEEHNAVQTVFNRTFFSRGDSRTPEQAGFLGAIMGSGLTLLICLLVVFPLGVMTAVYLEEFARPGKWVDIIEVNINNLAAVPSIVFGLLGLAAYINFLGMPRSSALVGGMTLAMMILPVIIITTRVALQSIPYTIRDAALALGATPLQVIWHHMLPLSLPGIMTGTILGMARAIGETAPLLLIGMVAFIVDLPSGVSSSATVMPVQIYLWASSPEAGFSEKTAAGILVLLVLLLAMNAVAIGLRKRFEVRW